MMFPFGSFATAYQASAVASDFVMSVVPEMTQSVLQPSPLTRFPSSQASVPCLNPSPHLAALQASVQVPVLLFVIPRSHSSVPAWTRPSPHLAALQASVQAPVSAFAAPVSHSSTPVRTKPSPQLAFLHIEVQAPVS